MNDDTKPFTVEEVAREILKELISSQQFYETYEKAMAPGIANGWPSIIPAPHTKNGRLYKVETASLLEKLIPILRQHGFGTQGQGVGPKYRKCGCRKGDTCGHKQSCKFGEFCDFSRPSEPAAPQASAEHLKKCVKEGPDCDCVTVCKFDSPQPVSGDASKIEISALFKKFRKRFNQFSNYIPEEDKNRYLIPLLDKLQELLREADRIR